MKILCLPGIENDEEIIALEEEIKKLQKSNAQMEAQMMKLRNQISCMETKITQHEKDNETLEERTMKMNDYLMCMRKSLIERLRDIKIPHIPETLTEENFDSYIGQLRSLCMENYTSENKALYSAVKQALADINLV